MKFKLVEEVLKQATPYMLRNDGEIFQCGTIHPYIIKDGESIKDIISKGIDIDALYWFYTHTGKASTKKNIQVVAKYFIDKFGVKDDFIVSIYSNDGTDYDFNLTPDIYTTDEIEIRSFIEIVSDDTNQEFCRVRTSDKLWGGKSNGIYFRISSVDFNWFPIIWDFVYNNKDRIDSITICKDSSIFGGVYEPYKVGREVIDKLPTNAFLTLSGNPIIEQSQHKFEAINQARVRMSKGSNVSEAYDWIHPVHAHNFYKRQIEEDLEHNRINLLRR